MKAEFDALAEKGFVSAKRHPALPLTLYCYTQRAVFENVWDTHPLVRKARGLVLHDQGHVVARPFEKFFNVGERPETLLEALPAGEVPELSEKLDGSLIIAFYFDGKWHTCTKGAWDSPQAQWAQAWFDGRKSWADNHLSTKDTYLFELLAPWNRIVVPYTTEELVLLSAVHAETGEDLSYESTMAEARAIGLRAPKVIRGAPKDLDMALKVDDQEGFVVRYSNGLRVKMKYDCYKALHKIVTGLSEVGIWERLQAGEFDPPDSLPDEFMAWYRRVRTDIIARQDAVEARVDAAWGTTARGRTRKEIAIEWQAYDPMVKACLFRRLDGKQYRDLLWKASRPERARVFKVEE